MSNILVDYSEFLTDYERLWGNGGGEWPQVQFQRSELFFEQNAWCPFCRFRACEVFRKRYYKEVNVNYHEENTRDIVAWMCVRCGWWHIQEERTELGYEEHLRYLEYKHAIVRTFAVDDAALPLDSLRRAIHKKPNLIYNVHPRKLEELVQAVFSAHHECEVSHCGRSHDGGVDLILVNGDRPVLVQVKRRESRDAYESVSTVREFLGAVLLHEEGGPGVGCAFVTTADRFSLPAKRAAEEAVLKKFVAAYELVDVHSFLDMLEAIRDLEADEAWKEHLPEREDWNSTSVWGRWNDNA
jgi:hypothetical protein